MESLRNTHKILMKERTSAIRRGLLDTIDSRARLIAIKGSRGVGKTNFLLDFCKDHYKDDPSCLYVNINNLFFAMEGLFNFVERFYKLGGKVLLLDQIHKYPNWDRELREAYDRFPDLQIVFTASSILRVKSNKYLHGIVEMYNLSGLSFREFLELETGYKFPVYSFEEIVEHHEEIVNDILEKVRPLGLHNLNLTLNHGQIIGLLGPNGSGKTTLIKLINDLLTPTEGTVLIDGELPGVHSKNIVSYLPDHSYLDGSMKIQDLVSYFADFYEDFSKIRATSMLKDLNIDQTARLKTLSKGNQEKVALILVMSRDAKLYILDEPIGGVDPAARDYILHTILSNYNEHATILISTHLISDIENILDRVLFIQNGELVLNATVDDIRSEQKKSVDALFREVFKC